MTGRDWQKDVLRFWFGELTADDWFIDAVNTNDVNVVAAVIVFNAVLVLIAGLIADVLYAALDPRVRIR